MTRTPSRNSKFASYRVISVLKRLTETSQSIDEIIKFLQKIDPKSKIYTKSVVLKYLKTLKALGVEILKSNGSYFVRELPFIIKLDDLSIPAVALLKNFSNSKIKFAGIDAVEDFVAQLETRLSKETQNKLSKEYLKIKIRKCENCNIASEIIEQYEKYCKDNYKMKITYLEDNDETTITSAQPLEVKLEDSFAYFTVIDLSKNVIKDILIDRIEKVSQYPQKMQMQYSSIMTTTFELKGKLAKTYQLKDGERISKQTEDAITVVNNNEDKQKLMHRLLKYGEFVEIISPKAERFNIKNEIAKMLKNYEE